MILNESIVYDISHVLVIPFSTILLCVSMSTVASNSRIDSLRNIEC